MDEEVTIIDSKTRNEKIKNFLLKNAKLISFFIIALLLVIIGFYIYQIFQDQKRESISNKYNSAVIEYNENERLKTISELKEVVNSRDSTYSPLALYFIIDNNLVDNRDEVNKLFDVIIDKTSLELEIKNLIIYEKKQKIKRSLMSEAKNSKIYKDVIKNFPDAELTDINLKGEDKPND